MKPLKIMLLAAILVPVLPARAKEKKPALPEIFNQARTIYVQAEGGREFDPYLDSLDRVAIADVRDALRAWNRYKFTSEREEADLIVVVRKARAMARERGVGDDGALGRSQFPQTDPMGGQLPGAQHPAGPVMQPGEEPGAREDQLAVYQPKANGKPGKLLWSSSAREGLTAPRLALFEQFKDAVERAYPKPSGGPPTARPGEPQGPAARP